MYGLVPYNISEIQKGIQYGHAVVEYGISFFNDTQYQDWARNWKTFMILNGGTSNHTHNRYGNTEYVGSMETHLKTLIDNGVKVSTFYEPDLNDMLSGIVFIVDERVFNTEKYPDFNFEYGKNFQTLPLTPTFQDENEKMNWDKWVETLGGEQNLFLRYFLRNFRLA